MLALKYVHDRSSVIIWVIFELALRPNFVQILREELSEILETDMETGKPTLTNASLCSAERLDSFIREVLRTKGDTLAVFRLTTKDAPLGPYVIPKSNIHLL